MTTERDRLAFECRADEYEALASQLHESIAGGQSVEETAKMLRLFASMHSSVEVDALDVAMQRGGDATLQAVGLTEVEP